MGSAPTKPDRSVTQVRPVPHIQLIRQFPLRSYLEFIYMSIKNELLLHLAGLLTGQDAAYYYFKIILTERSIGEEPSESGLLSDTESTLKREGSIPRSVRY